MDFDIMMRQLECLLRAAYKKHEDIRFVCDNRRLTMYEKGRDNYFTVTWRLDSLTDSISKPANWPEDL